MAADRAGRALPELLWPRRKNCCSGFRRRLRLGVAISDQKGAEKVLQGIRTSHGRACGNVRMALSAGFAQRLADLLQHCDLSDGGANNTETRYHGRGLIYRSVDFVVGSLGKVGLGNRRNAKYSAQQEQYETPNSALHLDPSMLINNNRACGG